MVAPLPRAAALVEPLVAHLLAEMPERRAWEREFPRGDPAARRLLLRALMNAPDALRAGPGRRTPNHPQGIHTMKKDLGTVQAVFPMPVLVIAAYDKAGTIQTMNAAWGQICDTDKIALFLDADHATTKAIRETGAFTVALADRAHMAEADYVGIVSGNQVADKFARSGLHAAKSSRVNAPVLEEFPVAMECTLAEIAETKTLFAVVGTIVNTLAEERVLDEQGKVDPAKLDAIAFDQFRHGYYATGEKAGQAWNAGSALAKAALGR